jgi:hypothetical protein
VNLSGRMNFDIRSLKILFEKFERKNFLDIIDDYRCNEYYIQLIEDRKIDRRINDMKEIIDYVKNKHQQHHKHLIKNVHYISR